MPTFNPGDQVRRIGHNWRGVRVGAVYTVTSQTDQGISLEGLPMDPRYDDENFELVEAAPLGEEYTCYLVIFGRPDGTRRSYSTGTEQELQTVIQTFTRVGWTVKAKKRIKTVLRNQPEGI